MKLTDRERKLVLILPAVAVLIGYAWYYSFSLRPQAAQAQRDYEAAVAADVAPPALVAERMQVAGLQRELKELGETKARLDRDMAAAGNREDPTAGRIATHQDLTGLFRRHGLQLVEESQPTAEHVRRAARLAPCGPDPGGAETGRQGGRAAGLQALGQFSERAGSRAGIGRSADRRGNSLEPDDGGRRR